MSQREYIKIPLDKNNSDTAELFAMFEKIDDYSKQLIDYSKPSMNGYKYEYVPHNSGYGHEDQSVFNKSILQKGLLKSALLKKYITSIQNDKSALELAKETDKSYTYEKTIIKDDDIIIGTILDYSSLYPKSMIPVLSQTENSELNTSHSSIHIDLDTNFARDLYGTILDYSSLYPKSMIPVLSQTENSELNTSHSSIHIDLDTNFAKDDSYYLEKVYYI